MKVTLLCVLCIEWTLRSADDLSGLNPRTGDYQEPQIRMINCSLDLACSSSEFMRLIVSSASAQYSSESLSV